MYDYAVTLDRVIDGDSVDLDIDLGFRTWIRNKDCRLGRIDAPEMTTAAGPPARDALAAFLAGKVLTIHSIKLDKYGRPLIELYADGVDVNDEMVAAGYAVPYDGGAR